MKIVFMLISIGLFHQVSNAQSTGFSIHACDPLSIWKKAGLKLELRQNKVSVLITGVQTYNFLTGNFGGQAGLEGRIYSKVDSIKSFENFIYFRYFEGHQQHTNSIASGLIKIAEAPGFNYYGAGIGVGRKFLFHKIFVDFNIGIKYTIPETSQGDNFYILGTGSFLEFHSNLGYRF